MARDRGLCRHEALQPAPGAARIPFGHWQAQCVYVSMQETCSVFFLTLCGVLNLLLFIILYSIVYYLFVFVPMIVSCSILAPEELVKDLCTGLTNTLRLAAQYDVKTITLPANLIGPKFIVCSKLLGLGE